MKRIGIRLIVLGAGFLLTCGIAIFSNAGVREVHRTLPRSTNALSATIPSPVDWPQWRGSRGDNIFEQADLPGQFSDSTNLKWKSPIPGRGHSTPCTCRERIFLSTSDDAAQTISLISLNAEDGSPEWQTELHRGGFGASHWENSYASASPACDGRFVYVVSPVRGSLWITAVSHEGKIEWQREAGPFAAEWGYGSSPVLYQSLVIACADHRGSGVDRIVGSSWIAALDRETGEIIWRVKRNEGDSFGTPIVVRIGGTDQLVLAGKDAVISYEPATGEILWKCRWDCKRVANTVAFDDRHVFVSTRQPRPETLCIDASGRGDVTGTHIVWRENKSACDVPSPCVFEGRVFLMADEGILICLNATNGHVDWKRRLGGKVSASPTIIGRRIYCCGEEGTVSVVSPDGQVEYETNLGEAIMSSAIATPVRLYVRAANNLYCFQK